MPKEKPFDPKLFESLCQIQCTKEEISAIFEMDESTLNRKVKKHYGEAFAVIYPQKKAGGKVSLRRSMYLNATQNNNATMQIWLSKNWLAMRDQVEILNKETRYDDPLLEEQN